MELDLNYTGRWFGVGNGTCVRILLRTYFGVFYLLPGYNVLPSYLHLACRPLPLLVLQFWVVDSIGCFGWYVGHELWYWCLPVGGG